MTMLQNKNIIVGVTGGIAAYKACDLISRLKKMGANVKVIMTQAATEFITPLTLQSLSQNPVATGMFDRPEQWEIEHIALAKWADVLVIAPATANLIGKMAGGIADDLLSTTLLATRAPIYLAPAMNTQMYAHPVVQANIQKLRELGIHFIDPETGRLACGDIGAGKLADIDTILATLEDEFSKDRDYAGKRILITAGPTREAIDPVRFLSNHSSGKMGYALAKSAVRRGAAVTLISGPVALERPDGLEKFIPVESAAEMYQAVLESFASQDIVIMSAAVADYRPKMVSRQKIKKTESTLAIELTKNIDILAELGKIKQEQKLIGFAAETEHLEEYARKKLLQKNLDLIVANDLTQAGAGFGVDTNIVKLIDRSGIVEDLPLMSKADLSNRILDRIKSI